jgi:urea transport system permease protein
VKRLHGGVIRRIFASRRSDVLLALSLLWIASAAYLWTKSSVLFFSSFSVVAALVLVAVGLTIVFGIMGIANFAHGDFVMLGAVVASVITAGATSGLVFYIALPIAFVVPAVVGLLMEVGVLRWVYSKGFIAPMLATWAVGIILREAVRLWLGTGFQRVSAPLTQPWRLGNVTVPSYDAFMIAVAAIIVGALVVLYTRTPFGLKSRATAEDRIMAEAVGINVRAIYRWSLMLGSGLAGLAGALISPLVAIDPYMGVTWLVKGFLVVIVGGPASIGGAVLGGNAMGWPAQVIGSVFASQGALYGEISVVALAAIVLMVRPQGLATASDARGD